MFVSCEKEPNIPRGYTLLLPAVSVGNVGQLAVDLIVHTLGMERIGYLHTDCLLPMVGNNPFATSQEDASQLATVISQAPQVPTASLQDFTQQATPAVNTSEASGSAADMFSTSGRRYTKTVAGVVQVLDGPRQSPTQHLEGWDTRTLGLPTREMQDLRRWREVAFARAADLLPPFLLASWRPVLPVKSCLPIVADKNLAVTEKRWWNKLRAGKSLRKMGDCGDGNDNHFDCSSRYRDGRKHAGVERRTEVYRSVEKNLVAVQQRAPLVRGKQSEFRRRLLEWAKQCGFSRVVLLTSSHAYERIDTQMTGTQLRYLLSPELEKEVGRVAGELKWTQLERRKLYPGVEHREGEEHMGVFIPGGGITRKFYQECCEADFPLAVLLTFCAEGDNIPDAFSLANYVNQWLQLVPSGVSV
ncbi:PSMG2 [Branchiostoma lanceolatum]|uniref:Proteasome assembly chaperone 2 n=1 Tax=Branchiostoma lanceolatum TaxID=7740 RepID=A0A8K0A6R3_BRALA|nr:PSMG2 [Branchiostoma lanceolatum]